MRVLAIALLLACGGRQPQEDDPAPEPGELDLDEEPRPTPRRAAPSPSSSTDSPVPLADTRAPRFRGRPIDIDVRDADLHNVFRLIADAGGVSIAVADDVKGTITLRLRQVPWDQALDTVVRLEKLELERQGDVYLIRKTHLPPNAD